MDLARRTPADGGAEAGPSSSGATRPPPARVSMAPATAIPMHLLVARQDPVPDAILVSRQEQRRLRQDVHWAQRREYLLAAAAAGAHLLWFAYNLAFWGFEGMAPDRYWPENPRIRLQMRPGRYGNLWGAKRVSYRYMSAIEGAPPT